MSDIVIRPAQRSDAADLAILDNKAGHGISLWFWQKAVADKNGADALDWGRSRFASDEIFGWSNAYVGEVDGMIVGSITSYLMPETDEGVEDIKSQAPAFVPVFELYSQATDTWFIDSFATYQDFQGKGYGRSLLTDSLARGKSAGANRSMLVCEDNNAQARPMYEKFGFVETDRRPFIDFGLGHQTNHWLLMAADL